MSSHEREGAMMTGATSGIGRAIAIRLAKRGAAVAVLGRNIEAARQVATEVTNAGGVAFVAQTDVTDVNQVEDAVGKFVAAHGGVDTAVSPAGDAPTGGGTECHFGALEPAYVRHLRRTVPSLLVPVT